MRRCRLYSVDSTAPNVTAVPLDTLRYPTDAAVTFTISCCDRILSIVALHSNCTRSFITTCRGCEHRFCRAFAPTIWQHCILLRRTVTHATRTRIRTLRHRSPRTRFAFTINSAIRKKCRSENASRRYRSGGAVSSESDVERSASQ